MSVVATVSCPFLPKTPSLEPPTVLLDRPWVERGFPVPQAPTPDEGRTSEARGHDPIGLYEGVESVDEGVEVLEVHMDQVECPFECDLSPAEVPKGVVDPQ